MPPKTRYEFIHFERLPAKGVTSLWACCNNRSGDELGRVGWYGAWRQYCFEPTGPAVYSSGCLADIKDFVDALFIERQIERAEASRTEPHK